MKMKTLTVKPVKEEFKKRNCLTCKHSDTNNGGIPCKEGNSARWDSCFNQSKYEPVEKLLHLVLAFEWFDKIKSGEKTTEYRECKLHWDKKFNHYAAPYTHVKFQRGYSKDPEIMIFEVKEIVRSSEQNDLKKSTVWAIRLGERIS